MKKCACWSSQLISLQIKIASRQECRLFLQWTLGFLITGVTSRLDLILLMLIPIRQTKLSVLPQQWLYGMLQYEFVMVTELIKLGHPDPVRKVRFSFVLCLLTILSPSLAIKIHITMQYGIYMFFKIMLTAQRMKLVYSVFCHMFSFVNAKPNAGIVSKSWGS